MRRYLIWFLVFIFFVVYSVFSIVRHLRFETDIFDLGYYDQLIWNYGNGNIESSILEYHPWIDHFTPSLFLLTPLFWLWNSPIILLIFQALFISLGAYPIYKLSQKYLKNNLYSLAISFCYLSFFGIQNAIAYDFHPIVLIAALVAWITWFYENKKFKLFWILAIIIMGLQENGLLIMGAYGLFVAAKYRDFKRGFLLSIISGVILLFIIQILVPGLGSSYYYYPSHVKDLSTVEILKLLYTPTSKLKVLLVSFGSFGFLPLGSLAILPLYLEEFLGRFIGTLNPNRWVIGYHYDVILAPIMAIGSIFFISSIKKSLRKYLVLFMITCSLITSVYVSSDIKRVFNKDFYNIDHTVYAREMLTLIPNEASVAATNNLGAQIAHRRGLVFLANCIDNPNVWGNDGKRCFKLFPDYIVADFTKGEGSNDYYPDYSKESLKKYVQKKIENGEYQVIFQKGDAILLKKI